MTTRLSATVLGSGTSTGVPLLGCHCPVCSSKDPKDNRYRASLLLQWDNTNVVIDTGPEFRLQMLRESVNHLDAVLLTHGHADHIHGMDDLRQYTFKTTSPIPVFGNQDTLEWIEEHYCYIWKPAQIGGGLPKVTLNIRHEPFLFNDKKIIPVPVMHGILNVSAYRIDNLAYVTDVSYIPPGSMKLLEGVEVLFIDATRREPHSTHMHLSAAIEAAQTIGAGATYLTHLNHEFGYQELLEELPDNIYPAYDGLQITL